MAHMARDLANSNIAGTCFSVANKVHLKNYFLEKCMFAGVLRALKELLTFSGKP